MHTNAKDGKKSKEAIENERRETNSVLDAWGVLGGTADLTETIFKCNNGAGYPLIQYFPFFIFFLTV